MAEGDRGAIFGADWKFSFVKIVMVVCGLCGEMEVHLYALFTLELDRDE